MAGSKGEVGGKFDISCKKGLPMIPSCTVFTNSKWRPMVRVESGKWWEKVARKGLLMKGKRTKLRLLICLKPRSSVSLLTVNYFEEILEKLT